ncbi:perlucin-like protein [Ylistrum balloti]|uniref:perlucin-like protein n=1 Tax=Ylistrum balloti TaxID=509963 RepID=UPI002905DBB9|nr:perlucin-like protein [Ylistrum balloti]
MNVALISLLFGAVLCTEVAGWACPPGWVPNGGHCYLFSTVKKSWYEATYECARLGGALVSFNSPKELWWVKNHVKKLCNSKNYWFSGNDIRHEGIWSWNPNTGEINRDCRDWAHGEPNSWRGLEQDCALMWASRGYSWDDEQCHLPKEYICERYMFSERVCSCRI